MEPIAPITGGCLCGGVRYEIGVAPLQSTLCHCSMCRKATGGVLVPWVTVPVTALLIVKGDLRRYKSSAPAVRSFCPDCGTQITFWHEARAGEIDVTHGSLDDPDAFPPTLQIFAASRPKFMKGFDPALPSRDEY
ncbi:MAG: GFA family protein [Parvibaculum sp.]|uniref:GFA family protein n=1 Tax=Parvibaculum sp. TaxID=2024848 RepID=UPI0025D19D37|nr:GFA family protein [Parvibaculum sp.]MCE9649336.1 GFA family protein [Parvibaculum sp.]